MTQSITVLDKAKTHLITYHPFYASILLKRELMPCESIPTAAIDARGQIRYNPKWLLSMTRPEVEFLLAHECMHYMFTHLLRKGHRDPMLWNYACDAVINEMLKACQLGQMPKGGVEWPGAEQMSAEEVYDMLPEKPDLPKRPGGSGDGEGPGEQGDEPLWGIGEDLDDSVKLDEAARAEIEAEARVEMREAINTAKRVGKLPAPLKRMVDKLLEVKTPWYEKMFRFFTRASDNDYSYNVFDRRFLHISTYLPWFDGQGLNKAVIINDVSGSISTDEQNEFGGHFNRILETCQPAELYCVYVHTQVCKVDMFTPDDFPVMFECDESGGTDMTAGIKWVVENHPDADCIVVLTDGYTPFGNDCGIPTFWAITSDKVAPWGETVKLEIAK